MALWIGADCSGLVRIAAVGATSIRSNPELEFRSAPVYSGLLWIRVAVGSAEQKKKRNSRSVKIGRVWSSLRKITQHVRHDILTNLELGGAVILSELE